LFAPFNSGLVVLGFARWSENKKAPNRSYENAVLH